MKKKYTTPGIVKVELKPEQAVLGQCSGVASGPDQGAGRSCGATCRSWNRNTGGDAAAS